MEFREVIRRRRSVRKFRAQPIPEEVLHDILEAGRLAPSGGNAQNHVFGVIEDQAKKEQLARAAGNQDWIATAPVVIALCASIAYDLAEASADDFGLIVNKTRFGERLVSYLNAYPDRRAMNIFWNNAAPLIPGQQMFLAAINYGLHACWIGYLDTVEASKILGLPDDLVCLFLLPIGYADEEPEEKERKSLQELVFFDKWPLSGQDVPILELSRKGKAYVPIYRKGSLSCRQAKKI